MNERDINHLCTPRDRHSQRKRQTRSSNLKRSCSYYDVSSNISRPTTTAVELSVDNRAPGLLKIFGELVVAGAQYKSVLASTRSTAQELIKQALERYGLTSRLHRDFVLCESIGTFVAVYSGGDEGDNKDSDSSSIKKNSNQRVGKTKQAFHRLKSKFVEDRSPCGSPRVPQKESPRTPLGSPRTPCGSPSTVRDSPRVRPGDSEQRCSWTKYPNNDQQPDCPSPRQWKTHLKSYQERADSQGIDHRLKIVRNLANYVQIRENGIRRGESIGEGGCCWKPISVRVLIPSDRPLELQEFWKPPDGFSRRYELRRKCDVNMEAVDNETLDLNDNARKIMMSKVSPGVIPYSSQPHEAVDSKTILKDEWNKASATRQHTPGSSFGPTATNVVEGDPRQAYVCPSIYPYLLTLRGCSIHRDLVLYPLKSMSLIIGSAEKKLKSDDIKLSAEDISPAHCRVTLKRLPQFDVIVSEEKKPYWYCLDLDILDSAFVSVNGVQVKLRSTLYPGDLLGIGRQYLFLYKDPTGGHDIPSAVPWLPEQEVQTSLLAHINVNSSSINNNSKSNNNDNNNNNNYTPRSMQTLQLESELGDHLEELEFQHDDSNYLDDSSSRNTPIFLAYHKDKELELLESIADIKCHAANSFPLAPSLLFLASHQYAVRKFPGDHQTTFFKRLVRVVRARIGVVSRAVSQQRQESAIFCDGQTEKLSPSDKDYFPCLVSWLSNIVCLMDHFRMPSFQRDVNNLARRNDVIAAVRDVIGCFESSVNFLFQQTVYNVTKVLYEPISKFMEHANPDVSESSSPAIRRILSILKAVRRLAVDLALQDEVANQLMVYLLFFVSTTLFNRIIAKGVKLYNHESGSRLHRGISELESWATGEGLDVEFVRVSEHVLSMVDLLSSSKRTLMKLDWHSFQTQFSPLTDVQLCKILSEYDLGHGVTRPDVWLPPYPLDTKGELTISLSSHPPFSLPQDGKLISLCETFPPTFYRHLEQVQQKFSLVGEDVYCSGLSSAGNTPRLSESFGRGANLSTFFSQYLGSSTTGPNQASTRDRLKQKGENGPDTSKPSNSNTSKRMPPPPPPKPQKGPNESYNSDFQEKNRPTVSHIPAPIVQHQPLYKLAIQQKGGQLKHDTVPKPIKSVEPERRVPFVRPIVVQHGLSTDFTGAQSKQLPLNYAKQINVLPNMSDVRLLHRNPDNVNASHKQNKMSNRNVQSSDNFSVQDREDNSNLSSSYPTTRPRPSSATDCVHSSLTGIDYEDQYQMSNKKSELLKRRSNSALGCQNNDPRESQVEGQRSGSDYNFDGTFSKCSDNNSSLYDHGKGSRATRKSHTLPICHSHEESNRGVHNNSQGQAGIGADSNSYSYGSLKRSPRNMNLSRQALSDVRVAAERGSAIPDRNELPVCSPENGENDKPPPLPPRGELSKRQSPVGSRSPVLTSNNVRHGSPRESALSSSQRFRSGSRNSVEIQDITENQYIIYNPESPVIECFERTKSFHEMDHDKNVRNYGIKPSVLEMNRNMAHVPPLELPDDLLGISETESADEIFTNSFERDYSKPQTNYGYRNQPGHSHRKESTGSQGYDKYPDDIYIDVHDFSIDAPDSGAKMLKVLPLDNNSSFSDTNVSVRYRHSTPEARDTQGEVTGEVFAVTLNKAGSKLGMGLIDGLHTPLNLPGIFVRNVLPDTPAALCGCIRVGDRIVAVNGKSIVGADYDSAMRLIRADGQRLNLLVAKCDRYVASKISASTT